MSGKPSNVVENEAPKQGKPSNVEEVVTPIQVSVDAPINGTSTQFFNVDETPVKTNVEKNTDTVSGMSVSEQAEMEANEKAAEKEDNPIAIIEVNKQI